jgi:hypothetical protein
MKHHRSNRPARRNDGRIIGTFDGTTLRLKRKRSRHLYRALNSWCVDLATLVSAADAGVERVVVEDTESGETFETELGVLLSHGVAIDHGFGTQVALPLQYWLRSSLLQTRLGI